MTASAALRDAPERALRSLFMGLSHRRSLGRLAVRVPITRPMVGRFVAGESLPEVLEALERLREGGFATTVDVLGESVSSAEACAAARAECWADRLKKQKTLRAHLKDWLVTSDLRL